MSLTLEDRQQVHDLMTRYAWAVDIDGTEDEFLTMFTEDAAIDSPSSHLEGIQGVKDFARGIVERRKARQTRHVLSNLLIDGSGDRASVKAYLVLYVTDRSVVPPTKARSELRVVGNYECLARRVDGTWRFTRRVVKVDARPS